MGTNSKGSAHRAGATGDKYVGGTLAIAVAKSGNSKIGLAATTYAEQRSCPTSCPFFNGGGCYAERGRLGISVTAPLNRAAAKVKATPAAIARFEAAQIDAMKVVPGRVLRIHTVGDCRTNAAAKIVAAAAARYVARGGGQPWTYTHAWRKVERASWGEVHVLASCETPADVDAAHARGYTTALVTPEFLSNKLYEDNGVSVLPCPAQTKKGVTCASCGLCMDSERLFRERLTIGFEVHGDGATKRRAHLAVTDPNNPNRKLSSRVLIPRFIKDYRKQHGRDPKNSEIAKGIGISPSSVAQMRKRLAAEKEKRK